MGNHWRIRMENYNGLEVYCAPGVHAAAAVMLTQYSTLRSGVLDLGSGSGAFLARLRDLGYSDLHAIERNPSIVRLSDVQVIAADLDTDFAAKLGRQFALVSAIEVIEHLESPIGFLRQIASLLAPDGVVLLSTPNVAHWKSRLKFLLKGDLRYFDIAQYRYQRHVSPILPSLFPYMLNEAGLEPVEVKMAGSFDGWLKHAIFAIPAVLSGNSEGECLVALARRLD